MLSNYGIFNVVTNLRKEISRLYFDLVTNKLYKEKREACIFDAIKNLHSSRFVASFIYVRGIAVTIVGIGDVSSNVLPFKFRHVHVLYLVVNLIFGYVDNFHSTYLFENSW